MEIKRPASRQSHSDREKRVHFESEPHEVHGINDSNSPTLRQTTSGNRHWVKEPRCHGSYYRPGASAENHDQYTWAPNYTPPAYNPDRPTNTTCSGAPSTLGNTTLYPKPGPNHVPILPKSSRSTNSQAQTNGPHILLLQADMPPAAVSTSTAKPPIGNALHATNVGSSSSVAFSPSSPQTMNMATLPPILPVPAEVQLLITQEGERMIKFLPEIIDKCINRSAINKVWQKSKNDFTSPSEIRDVNTTIQYQKALREQEKDVKQLDVQVNELVSSMQQAVTHTMVSTIQFHSHQVVSGFAKLEDRIRVLEGENLNVSRMQSIETQLKALATSQEEDRREIESLKKVQLSKDVALQAQKVLIDTYVARLVELERQNGSYDTCLAELSTKLSDQISAKDGLVEQVNSYKDLVNDKSAEFRANYQTVHRKVEANDKNIQSHIIDKHMDLTKKIDGHEEGLQSVKKQLQEVQSHGERLMAGLKKELGAGFDNTHGRGTETSTLGLSAITTLTTGTTFPEVHTENDTQNPALQVSQYCPSERSQELPHKPLCARVAALESALISEQAKAKESALAARRENYSPSQLSNRIKAATKRLHSLDGLKPMHPDRMPPDSSEPLVQMFQVLENQMKTWLNPKTCASRDAELHRMIREDLIASMQQLLGTGLEPLQKRLNTLETLNPDGLNRQLGNLQLNMSFVRQAMMNPKESEIILQQMDVPKSSGKDPMIEELHADLKRHADAITQMQSETKACSIRDFSKLQDEILLKLRPEHEAILAELEKRTVVGAMEQIQSNLRNQQQELEQSRESNVRALLLDQLINVIFSIYVCEPEDEHRQRLIAELRTLQSSVMDTDHDAKVAALGRWIWKSSKDDTDRFDKVENRQKTFAKRLHKLEDKIESTIFCHPGIQDLTRSPSIRDASGTPASSTDVPYESPGSDSRLGSVGRPIKTELGQEDETANDMSLFPPQDRPAKRRGPGRPPTTKQ